MKLTITISTLDNAELTDEDLQVFLREAKRASSMNLEVGRPMPGITGGEGVFRHYGISVETFHVSLEAVVTILDKDEST